MIALRRNAIVEPTIRYQGLENQRNTALVLNKSANLQLRGQGDVGGKPLYEGPTSTDGRTRGSHALSAGGLTRIGGQLVVNSRRQLKTFLGKDSTDIDDVNRARGFSSAGEPREDPMPELPANLHFLVKDCGAISQAEPPSIAIRSWPARKSDRQRKPAIDRARHPATPSDRPTPRRAYQPPLSGDIPLSTRQRPEL